MAALCMTAVLAFAPMAMAQDDLNCDDLSEAEEQACYKCYNAKMKASGLRYRLGPWNARVNRIGLADSVPDHYDV